MSHYWEDILNLLPVFCTAKYRGGVRRTEGLKKIGQKYEIPHSSPAVSRSITGSRKAIGEGLEIEKHKTVCTTYFFFSFANLIGTLGRDKARITNHTPAITNGILNNCPIFNNMVSSNAS